MILRLRPSSAVLVLVVVAACGGDDAGPGPIGGKGAAALPPAPSCEAKGGSATVSAPTLLLTLKDRFEEGWLGSPSIVDLDGDGKNEIVMPREGALVAWRSDGSLLWKFKPGGGRVWASAAIANFTGDAKLEIAVAMRDKLYLVDAAGNALPKFPVSWDNEMRAIAAGDVDGDGALDIVATTGHSGPTDVLNAWHSDASQVPGFPPNKSGASGCTEDQCYIAGCYDQNLALGDLDGDAKIDLVAPHDNAYASIHKGSGEAFDANSMFSRTKTPGIRYMHELEDAKKGFAEDEATALQAHFTNTAPAIADIDGDGKYDVVMLGSVQNASQDDRKKGVSLWVVRPDGSRLAGWETPFHAPGYLAGLEDLGDTNIVGATNQVTVADLDPTKKGPELVFAGFDGWIHAVSTAKQELWSYQYTSDPNVLTGGVVVADLSGDGIPEVVFATYSTDANKSALYIVDAGGNELHKVALPTRGSMAVPTIGDVNGDGTLEIVVSLKDAEDKVECARVYTVASSSTSCLLWPTARGNDQRNAWVRSK